MAKQMIWKGRLGVPYQGSKNQIARDIIGVLPRGKRFVDLFAGGCANKKIIENTHLRHERK